MDDVLALLPMVELYWDFEGIPGFRDDRVSLALERLIEAPGLGSVWVAIEGDIAVGYLLAVYVFSLEHQGLTAEIDELFVLPACRESGAGAGLLRAAEAESLRVGCTNISLQLATSNDAARHFYSRRGYERRPRYELLEKALSGGA